MNDEQLRALLQAGQITPSQYEMALDMVMNSPDVSGDMKNALERRGMDTPQERDMLQGLLGGGQQSPAQMPQAPAPEMPMMPIQSPAPSQMQMAPMPEISGRGAPTQNETDFLTDFVNNRSSSIGSRGVDTPQERDYLQNIMQNYNKGHNYSN